MSETLVGNASSTPPVPPMAKATLIDAFEGSFAPESAGGCPEVPPCPPPCKPPTYEVASSLARAEMTQQQRLRPNGLPWNWL